MLAWFLDAVVFGSILALFSLGLSLAWGTLDVLNMAHGSVFVFAGFIMFELTKAGVVSFLPDVALAIVAAGVLSALLEVVTFRRIRSKLRSKRQAELSILLASIGAGTIIDKVVSNKTGGTPFGPSGEVFHIHSYSLGTARITNLQILIIVVTLLAAVALDQWVRRSRQGRAIRAIAFDPDIAGLLGVNVSAAALTTMFIAGGLAGLAGALLAINLGAEDTTLGSTYLLTAFAILVVGGVGSVRGAVCAAYAIAIAETAVVAYGPAQWTDGVAFLLIMLMLLLRPQGLFARRRFERA